MKEAFFETADAQVNSAHKTLEPIGVGPFRMTCTQPKTLPIDENSTYNTVSKYCKTPNNNRHEKQPNTYRVRCRPKFWSWDDRRNTLILHSMVRMSGRIWYARAHHLPHHFGNRYLQWLQHKKRATIYKWCEASLGRNESDRCIHKLTSHCVQIFHLQHVSRPG